MAEPLTPERERYLRETHEWCVSDGMNHEAHHWIATLDAERALHHVSDAPGLREALERIAKGHDWQPGQPTHGWASCQRIADAALAASGDAPREDADCDDCRGKPNHWHHAATLAASGDAPREGLDVERLTAALEATRFDKDVWQGGSTRMEDVAAAVAREYASESHPTKERTDG